MNDDDFGMARVVQQGGDCEDTARAAHTVHAPHRAPSLGALLTVGTPCAAQDTVEEAIDSCPADCIHKCTRSELKVL